MIATNTAEARSAWSPPHDQLSRPAQLGDLAQCGLQPRRGQGGGRRLCLTRQRIDVSRHDREDEVASHAHREQCVELTGRDRPRDTLAHNPVEHDAGSEHPLGRSPAEE